MTYIHLAAVLVAKNTTRWFSKHEVHDFQSKEKYHTSGPIDTSSTRVLLRDCAESIVVVCPEQSTTECWHGRLLDMNGAICAGLGPLRQGQDPLSASVEQSIRERNGLTFHRIRPATPEDWVPRRDERREHSPRFLWGVGVS